MRYATLDDNRTITNIIEVEPDNAYLFDAHYLGDHPLGIGDPYPDPDLTPPVPPTETQLLGQEVTDLHLSQIEQGQLMTDLQLQIMEAHKNV